MKSATQRLPVDRPSSSEGSSAPVRSSKDRSNVETILPLTSQQAAMLLYCSEPGPTDVGFLQVEFDLLGRLDLELWQTAWRDVLQRHEAMRMTVESPAGKQPMTVVWKQVELAWQAHDLRSFGAAESVRRVEDYLAESRETGLPLDQPAVMRVATFTLEDGRHHVCWSCHHLFLDGWSSSIVVSDLLAAYRARNGGESGLRRLSTRYRDYRDHLNRLDSNATRGFWKGRLRDLPPPAPLVEVPKPFDGSATEAVTRELNETSSAQLQEACVAGRYTASALVRGVWSLTLGQLAQSTDVTFGAVVSGRAADLADVDAIAGFFSNVVPVRVAIEAEQAVEEWLRRLRVDQLDSQPHEHLPLADIVTAAGCDRTPFDTLLLLQNLPWERNATRAETLQIENYASPTTSVYPLTLVVIPEHRWRLEAQFDQRSFDVSWVSRLLATIEDLLHLVARAPRLSVAAIVEQFDWPQRAAVVEPIDALPQTGAALASSLPADALATSTVLDGYVAPRSRHELELVTLWQDALSLSPIGVRDDFFALGGSSMQALKLFAAIERQFDRRLQLGLLLQKPTIEQLAQVLSDGQDGVALQCLVPIRKHLDSPNLFCIHAGGGHVLFYRELAESLGTSLSVYGLQPVGIDGRERPLRSIQEIAARYLSEIRLVQPNGPYNLLGYCWGATVAFEMAHQLQAAGDTDSKIILVDSSAPNHTPRPLRKRIKAAVKRHFPLRRRHIQILLADVSEKRRIEMEMLQDACETAFHDYSPARYDGQVIFLRGSDSENWQREYWSEGLLEDWYRIAPQLEVRAFDCNHDEFFREPDVHQTAEMIQRYVDACVSNSSA